MCNNILNRIRRYKFYFVWFMPVFAILLLTLSCDDEEVENVTAEDYMESINENPSQSQLLGRLSATTNIGEITFTLISQDPIGALAINSLTGDLLVADSTLYDFKTVTQIIGTFSASNGNVKLEYG